MTQDRKTDLSPQRPIAAVDDAALDALFAETRNTRPDPVPAGLQARLLADALAARPKPAERPMARGWLARIGVLLSEIGGAPGLTGVGAAGLAGLWIGFSGPGVTGDLVDQVWQGAASLSPTVSAWGGDAALTETLFADAGTDLLTLMSGEAE
ncbi:MAG: hypothetical protein KDK01_14160 [Rhodobacteraceae bacterium]|jgi:hypothetical protein|nr:hypothetical protein [Paracoccaceae bacterium]